MQPRDMYTEMNSIAYYLDSLLDTAQANVYLKDTKGCYLECNHNMARINKINREDINGKTDFDLLWNKQALILVNNDAEIIRRNVAQTFIETTQLNEDGEQLSFISHKAPLRSRDGTVIGVTGISFLTDYKNPLLKPDQVLAQERQEQLTSKQVNSLYYLVKGMTAKQIGQKLNLSPRTVEDHINIAKEKLHCNNRTELVAMALQMPAIRDKL